MFNTDLLLYNIDSMFYAVWVFITAMFAMFAFASLTQGWIKIRLKWWEYFVLASVSFVLLMPSLVSEKIFRPVTSAEIFSGRSGSVVVSAVFLGIYALLYILHNSRARKVQNAA
jgi:TRAP-type uncharacterized transport system fused permease subunit